MAKANSNGITYQEVIRAVQRKEYKPVYLLMGDESYYIDRISDYIADNVLTEEEKGFNLSVIYCTKETEVSTIINAAKRYPMMSRYQVVVVKEAQNLSKSEDLFYYVQKPLESTILVICFKNGTRSLSLEVLLQIICEGKVSALMRNLYRCWWNLLVLI